MIERERIGNSPDAKRHTIFHACRVKGDCRVSRWFRLKAAAMRNPKVLRLTDRQFRLWVRLLAVASENDGKLPCADDLRLALSMRLDHLHQGLDGLIKARLIDALEVGYEPHDWREHQYKSDTSRDRVAKHRAKCNVTVTPPDTDTDTDTDIREEYTPQVASKPKAIPSPQKPSPRDILETALRPDIAAAVIDHRKAKRSPITAKAAELLIREFHKTGDPNAAAEMMIARGWLGFKIEWMENDKSNRSPRQSHGSAIRDALAEQREWLGGDNAGAGHVKPVVVDGDLPF